MIVGVRREKQIGRKLREGKLLLMLFTTNVCPSSFQCIDYEELYGKNTVYVVCLLLLQLFRAYCDDFGIVCCCRKKIVCVDFGEFKELVFCGASVLLLAQQRTHTHARTHSDMIATSALTLH